MTFTDTRAALDVDLNAPVPCTLELPCRRRARWLATMVHCNGSGCQSRTACAKHRRIARREIRRQLRPHRLAATMSAIFDQVAADWREMRAEFDNTVEHAYRTAERVTRGALLNSRGRAGGIDPFTLFTGPHIRVVAYGSDELLDYFAHHGRPSLARFERQWLTGRDPRC